MSRRQRRRRGLEASSGQPTNRSFVVLLEAERSRQEDQSKRRELGKANSSSSLVDRRMTQQQGQQGENEEEVEALAPTAIERSMPMTVEPIREL
jgi:hypothetical protein